MSSRCVISSVVAFEVSPTPSGLLSSGPVDSVVITHVYSMCNLLFVWPCRMSVCYHSWVLNVHPCRLRGPDMVAVTHSARKWSME